MYKAYLSQTYVNKFTEYNDQKNKIISIKALNNNYYLATTEIQMNDLKIEIAYRIKKLKDGKLKIRDIIGEGVSLITAQRSEFGSVLSNQGVDALIKLMEEKTSEFIC